MQLDIFDHSRDTQLRNDLADALLRQDIAAARTVSATLTQEFPGDACLAPAAILLRVLEQRTSVPLASHEEAEAARRTLHDEVEPAAQRLLGRAGSGPWLAQLWEALAQRAAPLPFDPRHGADHAAAFWLRAGEWDRASAAVARIASWRRIPLPLSWMAQARYRLQGLDESWDLLRNWPGCPPGCWTSCCRPWPTPCCTGCGNASTPRSTPAPGSTIWPGFRPGC